MMHLSLHQPEGDMVRHHLIQNDEQLMETLLGELLGLKKDETVPLLAFVNAEWKKEGATPEEAADAFERLFNSEPEPKDIDMLRKIKERHGNVRQEGAIRPT